MKALLPILVAFFLVLSASLSAQDYQKLKPKGVPKQPPREFQFIAYFYNHLITNNIFATNDFLRGQTVGRLFGGNTSTTGNIESLYLEQRLLPFFIYQPKLLDGRAILRASFEIDWTWGDASYGAGGNFGSAISADQVNIQTQNLELELIPWKGWAMNLGLQRLYDTPYNPYRTFFSTMNYTGYRLSFWGTDAVGLTVRHDRDYSRYKMGYYQLYENNIQQNDDVALWEFMYEWDWTPTWRQGLSFWYVYDRGNGEGGVSILGQGLNSPLNDYNGTFRFPLGNTIAKPYKADIYWVGTFWNRNPEFTLGRWSNSGFAVGNFGKVRVTQAGGEADRKIDIAGYAANMRTGYRYGQTADDIFTIDLLYTTGDKDSLADDKYNGVVTGNTWGSPANIFISSGAYLLFPHGNVVNRYIAAITDLSNLGLGIAGGTANFHKDILPHKLSAKVGFAAAFANYAPPFGGKEVGKEANFRIVFQPKVFMNLELHGAYLWLGDFYTSNVVNGKREKVTDPPARTDKPVNPWTVFLALKWLMF
jgi:hypothetical protein